MSAQPSLKILNATRNTVICQQAQQATTFLEGLKGLLGRKQLDAGAGLLIRPSSGVHTWGMRFPIDVVALDRRMKVTGVWKNVRPYRTCAISLRTWSVLELPVGQIALSNTVAGDQLAISG